MKLARHTKANKEFFEKGSSPTLYEWRYWVEEEIVKGKLIDGKPWIDMNWFAANDTMNKREHIRSGLELLEK